MIMSLSFYLNKIYAWMLDLSAEIDMLCICLTSFGLLLILEHMHLW